MKVEVVQNVERQIHCGYDKTPLNRDLLIQGRFMCLIYEFHLFEIDDIKFLLFAVFKMRDDMRAF